MSGPPGRPYPARVPAVEYPPGLVVRMVQKRGEFYWLGHSVFLGEALCHEPIGMEPLDERYWCVYYTTVALGVFDARRHRMLTAREAATVAAEGRVGRPPVRMCNPCARSKALPM